MLRTHCALLLVAMFAMNTHALSQSHHTKNTMPYVEGRLLVKTLINSPDDALIIDAGLVGAELVRSFSLVPGLSLYEFDPIFDISDAIQVFSHNPYVEYAEPDYIYKVASQNDSRFSEQWSLENTAQTGGTADADINAERMWSIEDGDSAVVIVVTDTGIDYTHPDLVANLWTNDLEIAGNGIDDDNNGYIDDIHGINAILNNGDPRDDHVHGTHVAGTIGADGNNELGVVGVAQDVKLIGCKFLGAGGSGVLSDAIQCLQYIAALKSRATNPVNIVASNNSWGGGSYSSALADAIRSHANLGILFVAAAGNSALDNDVMPSYPATYNIGNIISVAATDHNDRLAPFSNYGRRTVHVSAPGVKILSTVLNHGYGSFSGTSMAAPHVAGLVAVIKSRFPDYDSTKIKNLVIASGTPIASQNTISSRRIRGADDNGRGALTCVDQKTSARLLPRNAAQTVDVGATVLLSALNINCENPLGAVTVYNVDGVSITLEDNGTHGDDVANDGVYSLLWQPQVAGDYALDFGNGDTVTVTVQ